MKDNYLIESMLSYGGRLNETVNHKARKKNSLNEMLSESDFKDPIRLRIYTNKYWGDFASEYGDYLKEIVSAIRIKPEILEDNSDGTAWVCFPGKADLIELVQTALNSQVEPDDFLVE